jgi:hypothetical protein
VLLSLSVSLVLPTSLPPATLAELDALDELDELCSTLFDVFPALDVWDEHPTKDNDKVAIKRKDKTVFVIVFFIAPPSVFLSFLLQNYFSTAARSRARPKKIRAPNVSIRRPKSVSR